MEAAEDERVGKRRAPPQQLPEEEESPGEEESAGKPRLVFNESEVVHMELERGAMVRFQWLQSKPELNGKIALVTGGLGENGRAQCCVLPRHAPNMPAEELIRLAAKPNNLEIMPHPPDVMATAWNNLALAFKRAGNLVEANGAFMTAYDFSPPSSPGQLITLSNWIKLCVAMTQKGVADAAALQDKMSGLLEQLFSSVTSQLEFRGLDCVHAIDFVPGYSERQLMCGIPNSLDAPNFVSKWKRLFVFDQPSSRILEVHPESGKKLTMSGAAQQAMRTGKKVSPRGERVARARAASGTSPEAKSPSPREVASKWSARIEQHVLSQEQQGGYGHGEEGAASPDSAPYSV